MFDVEDENPSPGYWPSVSDLFITLFIIAIAILAAVSYALLPKNNLASEEKAIIVALGQDLENIRKPVNELREILGLPLIRSTQTPDEVMTAVEETCGKAAELIIELKELAEMSAPDRIEELLRQIEILKKTLTEAQAERDRLRSQLDKLTESGLTVGEILGLLREVEDLRRQIHDQPPNIQFSEQKEDYHFGSGSSSMGPKFIEGLRKNEFKRLADQIVARQEEGRVKVDTLEIIGHTDGRPFKHKGDLDQGLPDVLVGSLKISILTPGSNNDLGLLRALAVREQWEAFIADHDEKDILSSIEIRCYSAGQTILPFQDGKPVADDFKQDDAQARRIEMRLTRLKTDGAASDSEIQE